MGRFVNTLDAVPFPPRRRIRLRDGQKLVVKWEVNPGARGSILTVPGARGSDQGLNRVVEGLPRSGWNLVGFNAPGMGLSPAAPGRVYDLPELGRELAELATALPRPVIAVGHSFGCLLALQAAALTPGALDAAVLISPVTNAPAHARDWSGRVGAWGSLRYADALTALPAPLAHAVCDRPFRGWASNLYLARRGLRGWWKIVTKSREKQVYLSDPGAVAAAQRAVTLYGCTDFPAPPFPVALLAGSRDLFTSPAEFRELAAHLGASRAQLIPGAGHLLHHEDTAELAALLAAALTDLEAALTPAGKGPA